MLKLSIIGNGTLAAATRECCREHFSVFSTLRWDSDVAWFAEDTPIGKDGKPDADWIIEKILAVTHRLNCDSFVLVSSQLPVGSTARLEEACPSQIFAYQPENVRVKTAVSDFKNQARVVVGIRAPEFHSLLETLFAPFTKNLIITDPETAECVKHFTNAYLALMVCFGNEMARICKIVGADPMIVAKALRCERRVSPNAPLLPGGPYGGGHLERDIWVITHLAQQHGIQIPLISNLQASNQLTAP